jgi:hypothetical protein
MASMRAGAGLEISGGPVKAFGRALGGNGQCPVNPLP